MASCSLLTRILMCVCTMYAIQTTAGIGTDVTFITVYETTTQSVISSTTDVDIPEPTTTNSNDNATMTSTTTSSPKPTPTHSNDTSGNATETSPMTSSTSSVDISSPDITTTEQLVSTSSYVTHTEAPVVTTQSPSTDHDVASTEPSSTKSITTPAREPRSPTPAYPTETYPDISDQGTVFREIQVEVAVTYDSCDPPGPSDDCDVLILKFEEFAEKKYANISGFSGVNVAGLRTGSVIIQHNVYYKYNEMTPSDKQLSANEIYSKTLGPSVEGELQTEGDFNFTECTSCEKPKDVKDICELYVTCLEEQEASCSNNVWVCQSPCARTNDRYCTVDSAICTQGPSDLTPTCNCAQSNTGWYIGEHCQVYINRLGLILGTSIGGGLILILLIVLVICLCRVKKDLNESRKLPYEKTNEAFLFGRNDLEIDELEMKDTDHYDNKGYSQQVQAGELDDNFMPKRGRQVSNAELEQALQDRARQTDKNRNSQNMSFWGNLENDVIKEPHGNTPTSQNQLQRQSKGYPERKQSKPNGVIPYGKNVQPSTLPPSDNETVSSDPFSKRYTKILRDDYGGHNNN